MPPKFTFRRRSGDGNDDTIRIDEDTEHAWWASRDALETPVDRRWRRQPSGGSPPFRRADDLPMDARLGDDDPHDRWDPRHLFEGPDPAAGDPVLGDGSSAGSTPPWSVLGLTSDVTWPEVMARHRQLAKQHHPDRFAGRAVEEQRDAEVTMAAINAAVADLARIYQLTGDR